MKQMSIAGLLLALAACTGASSLPGPNSMQARFDRQRGAVQVIVSAFAPAAAAELVAPSGARYRAAAVTLLSGPYVAYAPPPTVSLGIGGFGFSGFCSGFGSGVGIGVPIGRPTPAAISDQYVSSAIIPAPADYPQHWSSYRVQVQVGTESVLLTAPPPAS